jgi:hypothetical protein
MIEPLVQSFSKADLLWEDLSIFTTRSPVFLPYAWAAELTYSLEE